MVVVFGEEETLSLGGKSDYLLETKSFEDVIEREVVGLEEFTPEPGVGGTAAKEVAYTISSS